MNTEVETNISVICSAKLNLTFEILGLMEDGYHEVRTLLQAIDLFDRISFTFSPSVNREVVIKTTDTSNSQFPLDQSNLIAKAVRMFQAEDEFDFSVSVLVEKNIPIAAGLAGGSANAAAALSACNHVSPNKLDGQELEALGSRLGADVPFSLRGGTAIGTGRGDNLTAVGHNEKLFFAIIKPHELSLSTPWVYKEFDRLAPSDKSSLTQKSIKNSTLFAADALSRRNLHDLRQACGNDLELPVFRNYPELEKLKNAIAGLGVWYCGLTGSGPTLWALVADREQAHFVRRKLLESIAAECGFPEIGCWIAESVTGGAFIEVPGTG